MRLLTTLLIAALGFGVSSAQNGPRKNRGNQKKKCGTQTVAGSKCLGMCLTTAQVCVLQVGNDVDDLMACVLDDNTEKSELCRVCIDELKANNCDEFFEELGAQGFDKNANDKLTPGGFKQLCRKIALEDECLDSGCYMNKRGCRAKTKKSNCNRVRRAEICDVIPGCMQRKETKNKNNDKDQEKVCKGDVDWSMTGRRRRLLQ